MQLINNHTPVPLGKVEIHLLITAGVCNSLGEVSSVGCPFIHSRSIKSPLLSTPDHRLTVRTTETDCPLSPRRNNSQELTWTPY